MSQREEKIMRFYREPTGREARDDEREAALRTIESLHPTANIALGSAPHGGATQYGEGCGRHGAWCQDWARTRKAVEALRSGRRKHPEPEITEETLQRFRAAWFEYPVDRGIGAFDRRARAALEAALRRPIGEGEQ